MKIAVTGAHRVGKTALAEKLHESLADYELRAEPYYELEELGHLFSELPEVDDFLGQLEYSMEQISSSSQNVIFDRCPIDFLAYIRAIDESENIQSVFNKVESVMSEIDLLVFVPVEEPDLIRCEESDLPELRYRINEILNDWIWDFSIETLEVKGTLLDRRNQILAKMAKGFEDKNVHR